MGSVLAETAVVGLIASILGILAGLLVAPALRELMAASGIELATTDMVLEARTIIISLVVGIVATVVSGFVPAAVRRASSRSPPCARPTRRAAAGCAGAGSWPRCCSRCSASR